MGYMGSLQLLAVCVISITINGVIAARPPVLPTPATHFMPGGIPKLIHRFYTGGEEAFLRQTEGPQPYYQRHWLSSCTVHSGSQWRTIMWDLPMAELLLETLHPDYLPHFRALDLFVKKCDAVRPFILHAYGGVYLDADVECFKSIEGSVMGYSLVAGEAAAGLVNNGILASAPGHMLMNRFIQRAYEFGNQSGMWVLNTLGPYGFTWTLQAYLQDSGTVNYTTGEHADILWQQHVLLQRARNDQTAGLMRQTAAPKLRIYQLGEWFTGCHWSNRGCLGDSLRCRSIIRAMSRCSQYLQRAPACHRTEPPLLMDELCPWYQQHLHAPINISRTIPSGWFQESHAVRCLQQFGRLTGEHLYSSTWLDGGFSQAAFSRTKAVRGVVRLMRDFHHFVEVIPQTCHNSPLSFGPSTWLQKALWPLYEPHHIMSRPTTRCGTLSLVFFPQKQRQPVICCNGTSTKGTIEDVLQLANWARQQRCHAAVFTNHAQLLNSLVMAEDRDWVSIKPWKLRKNGNSTHPTTNVPHMLYAWLLDNPGTRLEVLHVALPGPAGWAALRHLYNQGSYLLRRLDPTVLLLELGALPHVHQAWAETAYNHLYQELGYIGHAHMDLSSKPAAQPVTADDCTHCTDNLGVNTILPPLLLGLVRRSAVYADAMTVP